MNVQLVVAAVNTLLLCNYAAYIALVVTQQWVTGKWQISKGHLNGACHVLSLAFALNSLSFWLAVTKHKHARALNQVFTGFNTGLLVITPILFALSDTVYSMEQGIWFLTFTYVFVTNSAIGMSVSIYGAFSSATVKRELL